MQSPLFLALPDGLELSHISQQNQSLFVSLTSIAPSSVCPLCSQSASRIHSQYHRTLADVPCGGQHIRLTLTARKFFCDTQGCSRRIFTERFPSFVRPWARTTQRLCDLLTTLGFTMSAEAGSRFVQQLGIATSPSTLLRLVLAHTPSLPFSGTSVGIDDFAFRRGRTYGTLLIDLETHRVIDMLPDRSTPTVVQWLQEHPQITILSRDRGNEYATAGRQALPHAMQVADRFHLLKNFVESMTLALMRCRVELHQAYPRDLSQATLSAESIPDAKKVWKPLLTPRAEQARLVRHQQRMNRYEQIIELRAQKLSQREIAKRLGMGERTIGTWLAKGTAPEIRYRRKERSHFDQYAAYVLERWQQGCTNGLQLWREIQQQGYPDGPSLMYRYLSILRTGEIPAVPDLTEARGKLPPHNGRPLKRDIPVVPLEHFSAEKAVWWFVHDIKNLDETTKKDLRLLRQGSPTAEILYQLMRSFLEMLHNLKGHQLDAWLDQAQATHIPEIERFVRGIQRDKAAVLAGLTQPFSNGVVEGHVNRLKLLKRLMYGRASFPLLRQKVLYTVV